MIPGETVDASTPIASPAHDGDPIGFFQDNQGAGPGSAVCANNQFFVNGVFAFGDGQQCALPFDNADQTALDPAAAYEVTVAIAADGSYTATVTPLDVLGNVVGAFQGGTSPFTFSGTVPGDDLTQFVPFVRVRTGIDTGGNNIPEPDSDWTFTISETDLDVPQAAPSATVSEIECAEDESGTVVLTTSNPGTAGALLTVTVDGTARAPVLLAGEGDETESFTVPAGGSIAAGRLVGRGPARRGDRDQRGVRRPGDHHDDHDTDVDHVELDHDDSTGEHHVHASGDVDHDDRPGRRVAETGTSSSAPLATVGLICLVAGAAALALVRLISARRRRAQ